MRHVADEPEDSLTLKALTKLYCERSLPPTRAVLDRGLDAVRTRLAPVRAHRPRLLRWSLLGATAAVATLLALQAPTLLRRHSFNVVPPTLAYHVVGGSVLEGGYLRESGSVGVKVLFNEGSQFALAPGTRGRIRSVDEQGAHVTVEYGAASLDVRPQGKRHWSVDVGPFAITVKGTSFTVSWDPRSERFELKLRHGLVSVSGPVSEGEITMRAGQRLVVTLARAEAIITDEPPDNRGEPVIAPAGQWPAPSTLPASESGSPAEAAPPAVAPRSSTVSKTVGEHKWREALARGNWDRILDDVGRLGVEATLGKVSSEDLFAVADAARYRRRLDLARSALLAARRRFPDSPRALIAAFLLGRVEESGGGGNARAIAWYDEYLSGAPKGTLAGEALGRKMILTEKAHGPARARSLAEEYLRHFPEGSYAGSARALSGVSGQAP